MSTYDLMVFLHIMLLVFWLGTDLGVFLDAKRYDRSDLSMETRATILQLGMVLDRLPRSCLTLITPSGLYLASKLGLITPVAWLLPSLWLLSAVWLVVLWAGFLNPESAVEKPALLINLALNAIMALLLTPYAVYLLWAGEVATWLSVKILVVGLIFCSGVLLDVLFKPAVEAFTALIAEGPTPERDAVYAKAIGPVYKVVLVIYALVLVAAFMGVIKPF